MNPWVAVVRALPLTFIVYASTTVLGALQALPANLELRLISTLSLRRGSAAIASVESLIGLLPTLRALGLTLLLSLLAYALVTPWLHMSWLAALSEPKSPPKALGQGGRLMLRAMLTTLWVGLGGLVIFAPFPLLAWLVNNWLETRAHVRVQDLATLLFLTPSIVSLCVVLVWHDLARARCLSRGAFASARLSLRAAFRPRYVGSFVLWSLLSWALFGFATWLLLGLPRSGGAGLFSVVVIQAAALTRCVLRSRWLTQALIAADDVPRRTQ